MVPIRGLDAVDEKIEITTNIKFCEDGHRCENGSECIESEKDEGNYYCDCEAINENEAYHGLSCEHKATVYCNLGSKFSKISFCTNGGSCKKYVGVNDEHLGCLCDSKYEGPHCQFVAGTQPKNWHNSFTASQPGTDVQISGAAIFLITLICIAVVIGTSMVVWRGLKRRAAGSYAAETTEGTSSRNGELSVDGSSMKEAMSAAEVMSHKDKNEDEMETIMDNDTEII